MERIEALINKLKQQFDQHADPSIMAGTVQLLQFELSKLPSNARQTLGTSKVAVILPSSSASTVNSLYEKYAPKPAKAPVEEIIPQTIVEEPTSPMVQESRETVLVEEGSVSVVQKNGQLDMVFDPLVEIPTLSQQMNRGEINQDIENAESLNDRLKQSKTELIEVLKETPVKDLRKAIGINDRFLFINELFRGDETMYERSIKTINSFNIFAEAEYWISRELKIKLGWNKDNATVLHFDQLVRRRFS
jgi:hypothetical protein